MELKKDFNDDYDSLLRYISYFYQMDIVRRYANKNSKILEVGVGNKTLNSVLKNKGYDVTTIDILPELNPDVVGDVRSLPFEDNVFDIVVIYEVLEHLPYEYFKVCLSEISRVSKKWMIISLPYWNASFECILKFPGLGVFKKPPFFRLHLEIPYFFRKLRSKEHYFEIGGKGFPLRNIRKSISMKGNIQEEFSIPLNNHHRFFVCSIGGT